MEFNTEMKRLHHLGHGPIKAILLSKRSKWQKYVLYNSIYTKLKNKQNWNVVCRDTQVDDKNIKKERNDYH